MKLEIETLDYSDHTSVSLTSNAWTLVRMITRGEGEIDNEFFCYKRVTDKELTYGQCIQDTCRKSNGDTLHAFL